MGKMIRNKVENLLDALSSGALEREEAISLAFLSAAAGESIFLLGLPGVAKSMIARRLALAFKDACEDAGLIADLFSRAEIG